MRVRNPVAALRETFSEIAAAVSASAEYTYCAAKSNSPEAPGKKDAIVL